MAAINTTSPYYLPQYNMQGGYRNNGKQQGRRINNKIQSTCTHCGNTGHTEDICYRKHGFPPGYGNKNKSGNRQHQYRVNYAATQALEKAELSSGNEESQYAPQGKGKQYTLTKDQYQRLISMLPQEQSSRASSPSNHSASSSVRGHASINTFNRNDNSDALPTSNMNLKSSGELALQRNSMKRKQVARSSLVELGSSFVDSWHDSRLSSKAISGIVNRSCSGKQRKDRRMVVVSELAGQYEDSFEDVKKQIQNYFTYKAVRTVLNQLYEMNPTKYRWLYDFVVSNKPGDGKNFMRLLVKERQDLAERVMVTRLHLYGKWAKKCNHAEIYEEISNENLELMRERLMETVIWPSDDSNTEKIG